MNVQATEQVIRTCARYVLPTYARTPLVLTKGKGARVWDHEGHEYLDCFPGWGVSALGHCHPRVVQAVRSQLGKILHVPNNYYHPLQGQLAERITRHSLPGRVFFANSGAEVNEAAFKLARRVGHPERWEIIATHGSFHGRTLAAVTATGQPKYHERFGPLPPGFVHVPYDDVAAVARAVTDRTIAVIVEPIQGEGGVRMPSDTYLRDVRRLCDERGLLLILDEVQTGMGRTGTMFAFQQAGIEPDLMTLAKTLGGGMPIGALVVAERWAEALGPGSHASTFGGNPLACAAGLAVFEAIEAEGLLERVRQLGGHFLRALQSLASTHPVVRDVRGRGFMVGVELRVPAAPVVDACRRRRVLINAVQETTLRFLPPLNITRAQLDRVLGVLDEALAECTAPV